MSWRPPTASRSPSCTPAMTSSRTAAPAASCATVHGDLRAEHVIVADGAVEVFDPLEFDPQLRQIDVSADLAFLVMDLIVAGADELADALIAEYELAGGDHGGRQLLFFYAAYRAWVRAKVACLRASSPPGERAALAEARRFAEIGRRRVASPPTPGTGRLRRCGNREDLPRRGAGLAVRASAAQLGRRAQGARRARPDRASARGDVLGGREPPHLPRARARAAAAADGAIVDATFRRRAHRAAFAEACGGRALFVECIAPAAVVAERARGASSIPAGLRRDAGHCGAPAQRVRAARRDCA